jgi:hypothetical protein
MLSPEGTLFKSWNVLFSLSGGVLTNTWVAALQLQGQGPPCGPGRPDLSLRLSGAGKGGALPLAYRLPIRLTGRPSRAPGLNAQEPRCGLVSASPSGFPPVRAPPWVPPGFEAGPAPEEPLRFALPPGGRGGTEVSARAAPGPSALSRPSPFRSLPAFGRRTPLPPFRSPCLHNLRPGGRGRQGYTKPLRSRFGEAAGCAGQP